MHELSRRDARRIAVRAQLLDSPRPTDLLAVARRLTLLQLDPTAAIAPNADLVAWSRLGRRYRPQHLVDAQDRHDLIELDATLRPAHDLRLYRADMRQWRDDGDDLTGWQRKRNDWVRANDATRREILQRLRDDGPSLSRTLPDTCAVPWQSSGWTNDKNITQLLELMARRGEVAITGRIGRQRLWDLAERVYPDDPVVPPAEAEHVRNLRRLQALGLARPRGTAVPVEPAIVGEVGEPAVVQGVRGVWRVDPDQLGQPFRGRTALLSPFDRLLHDRKRAMDLFDFEYQLEMYKPASARRWGYFALPVLHGDRLVGKLDAAVDRKAHLLRVAAVHQDVAFTAAVTAAVDRQIADLARWLAVDVVRDDR